MAPKVNSLNIVSNTKPLSVVSKPKNNSNIEVFENKNTKANIDDATFSNANSNAELEEKADNKKKWLIGIGVGVTIIAGIAIAAYFKRDSIKNLFGETKIGKFIRENLEKAKKAKKTPIEVINSEKKDLMEKVTDKLVKDGDQIIRNFNDTDLAKSAVEYSKERLKNNPNILSELKYAENSVEVIKSTIELSGTGPTKIAQIISNDANIMAKLDDEIPDLAMALRKTKTECNPSRTFEEAIDFLEKSFPNRGYKLEKELGVGSIGATYLAQNSTGEKVAVKMIKKGISVESLEAEKNLVLDTISRTCSNNKFKEAKSMIDDLYKNWIDELNLTKSLEYNKKFSAEATRYSVAQIQEISKNGQCLVMEMSDGIQMNKLIKILKDYKTNPLDYATKYADLIKTNPWMSNPEKVLNDLPKTITEAFSEQFLFMKKGNISVMHGDPHTGNFFITVNNKGKLIPKFVDTDNCVIRSCAQIKEDVTMFANYLVGNSKKVAEYYVNQCGSNIKDKAKCIELVSKELKSKIFNGKNNITSYTLVQDNINAILKKYGLKLSLENTTALKSQLQFIKVIGESNRLSGKRLDVLSLIKDIPQAIWGMIKTGENPLTCVKDALFYAFKNPKETLINSGQFFV